MDIFERLFGRDRGDNMSETDTAEPTPDETETDASVQRDGDATTEQTVRDLDVRVRDLETSIDRTESSLKAIRGTQDELADDIGELSDTIRQLLGVYEQLTANSNPFSTAHDGFGVVGAVAETDSPPVSEPIADAEPSPEIGDADEDELDRTHAGGEHDEAVVTFDDLRDELLATDDEASMEPLEDELLAPEPRPENGQESVMADDDERGADTEPADTEPAVASDVERPTGGVGGSAAATLDVVAGGYAGDLLVMEWLSTLIEESGPASALKTIDYYESIGWLSPAARQQLETYLAGPHLDVHVDPSSPAELTAENHATSHRYVRRLATLSSNTQ